MRIICILFIALFLGACQKSNDKLPIWGNREPIEKTIDGKKTVDTLYHTIPDFKFVNQYGDTVTKEMVKGKIYVTDFFFTTCPTICPIMKRQMLKVYQKFKGQPDVILLSHTIDPEHDTPQVLKKYADELGVTGNQWMFLTGNREQIYKIAQSYLVAQTPYKDESVEGGFVHDGSFILIDKDGRVRGTNRPYRVIDKNGIESLNTRYDGTTDQGIQLLIEDIETLRKEYSKDE